ncbi:hypothetical protein H8356DRAFT_1363451 [Neocallimastix lanati (nom. inval.)]|nr:hypothetical protein H8356DRAFT_1363451 [Neocallimastix sp. JGI-2020a]
MIIKFSTLSENLITEFPYQFTELKNIYELTDTLYILKTMKYINVSNNKLNSIYTEHENHLKEDRILNRKEFVDNITKYKNLNSLILNNNQFNDNIFNNLTIFENLKILFVISNENLSGLSIKELPSNLFKLIYLKEFGIFKLYNLDVFDISYNPNLDVKFINFGKHKIYKCFVDGTPISCYQPNTCDNISEINSCTQKEIDDVLNSQLELTENDQGVLVCFFIQLVISEKEHKYYHKVMLTEMIYLYSKGSGENEQERCNTYTKTSHTKVLAITDLTQANTDGFKNFIKVSNTNNVFHHFIINVPSDTKIKELSRRRKFVVKFHNFTESSDFVGLDPINFIDWKAMGNKWFYHSLSLKLSNFPYFIAIGNTFTKKFLKMKSLFLISYLRRPRLKTGIVADFEELFKMLKNFLLNNHKLAKSIFKKEKILVEKDNKKDSHPLNTVLNTKLWSESISYISILQ